MLADHLASFAAVPDHRPWPRHVVDPVAWSGLGERLAGGTLDLLGLWGERDIVHMALREPATGMLAVASLPCPERRFPSIGRLHPPAIRLERTITDLFGLVPEGAGDRRAWLDHGTWPTAAPLGAGVTPERDAAIDAFLPAEGEGLHRIPVGPIHAGIIEPGHFRFTAQGETVVRLEARLGFLHKGIEGLLEGADLARAARILGRVSGDSTVAYALAFARAVEAATGTEPPARAVWLRALLAELERIANHLGDVGAICNDAAFALLHNVTGILRERLLATNATVFGHRLSMDTVVPGGVAVELHAPGFEAIRAVVATIRARLPEIARIYDETPSLMDRTATTGITDPVLVRRFAAGGHVGRAAGRDFDTRRDLAYAPYDRLDLRVPVRDRGDVDARVRIRLDELEVSLGLVTAILERLPLGPTVVPVAPRAGEGLALVEGFRGDVLVWLRLDGEGRILRCHPRDPSWFQWPLLEAAIEGNIVADFPLCNKSFNCSYSGVDL